jgi:drug/metabolite transporter (DMT)-like permease
VFSIVYLAALGTGFTFVTLTVLIRELPAVTTSFISLLIPFGALALGALVRGERVTWLAVAGAALVAGGIAVAQLPVRPRARA